MREEMKGEEKKEEEDKQTVRNVGKRGGNQERGKGWREQDKK